MQNLIIFPGWNRNEKTYRKLIELAPAGWKIYCLSYHRLIPFGDVKNLNKKILQFLDKKNIDKTNILGISLGGVLALKFAYEYPQKVEQLFIVDSEGVYGQRSIGKILLAIFSDSVVHKRLWEDVMTFFTIIKNPLLCFRLGLFGHNTHLEEEAKNIKTPTIILWGGKDSVTPLWQGKKLHSLIKRSKVIVVPGSHDWIKFFPEKFWSSIDIS